MNYGYMPKVQDVHIGAGETTDLHVALQSSGDKVTGPFADIEFKGHPRAAALKQEQIMRTHCEIVYNTIIRIPFLREAADIVLAHHEFFDGTGYPRGLRGEQIPLGARIISIANAFDAMLSDWPYRNALPMTHAREEIRRGAGTQFDRKIVEVFLNIPEDHWIDLRESLASPFRLTHLRNMGFVPQ